MAEQPRFIQVGKTYIENDSDGLPTGSLYKCIEIEDYEYVLQCLEFDCEDVIKTESVYQDDETLRKNYTFNS